MDLLQLEYFVRVAESPTMLQAAAEMNVSQSTLSMSIKKLEAELGKKLFRREGHSLKLTEEGELLHKGAGRILFEVSALKQQILSLNTGRAGKLIVASDAVDFSIETIYLYSELHPNQPVEHLRVKHSFMRSLLLSCQVDFCIGLRPVIDDNIESTLLLSEPMYLLAPSDSEYRDMLTVPLRALAGETLVTMQDGHALRELYDSYFSTLGLRPRGILEVGELEALSMSVRKRLGVSFVPQSVQGKEDFFRDFGNTLIARPMQESFCFRNLYLSRRKDTSLPPEQSDYLTFLSRFTELTVRLKRFPEREEYSAAYPGE